MKGGADLFVENLPGFPDNIRPSGSGGYWVGMAIIRPNPGFSVLDFLSERLYIKRMIFKVMMETIITKSRMKMHVIVIIFGLHRSKNPSSTCNSSFSDSVILFLSLKCESKP